MTRSKALQTAAQKRDSGSYVTIPRSVLNSAAYISLSPSAVKLLMDVANQYMSDNNGHLYCAWKVMHPRGWKSETTLQKAKEELLVHGLLFESRKGARPNRAAWYALTWLALDNVTGMDIKPDGFPRGAYRHFNGDVLTPIIGVSKPR